MIRAMYAGDEPSCERSKFTSKAISVAIAALVVFTSGCASRTGHSTPGASGAELPTRSGVAVAPPPTPVTNPWIPYATDVNPGQGIGFVDALHGWRLNGQAMAPHIDGNLAAGPEMHIMDWPGTSVESTRDGGASWATVLSRRDGVWGFDLLTAQTGWAVGVTALLTTTDGGASWKTLGEPGGTHLVRVQFASATTGLGIGTKGDLFRTVDGGASWQQVAAPFTATDACLGSSGRWYATNPAGDVYSTADNGRTWATGFTSELPSSEALRWDSLTCGGGGIWASTVAMDRHGAQTYVVAHSADSSARNWVIIASNDPAQKSAPTPVGTLASVAAQSDDSASVIGVTGSTLEISVARTADQSGSYSTTRVPLPSSAGAGPVKTRPAAFVELHGATFVGPDGWIWLTDTALGSASEARYAMLLLRSHDGGQSWQVANQSAPQTQPSPAPLSSPSS